MQTIAPIRLLPPQALRPVAIRYGQRSEIGSPQKEQALFAPWERTLLMAFFLILAPLKPVHHASLPSRPIAIKLMMDTGDSKSNCPTFHLSVVPARQGHTPLEEEGRRLGKMLDDYLNEQFEYKWPSKVPTFEQAVIFLNTGGNFEGKLVPPFNEYLAKKRFPLRVRGPVTFSFEPKPKESM